MSPQAPAKIKISLVQLDVGPDRSDNVRRACLLADRAASAGAVIVCLPELFNYMGSFRRPSEVAEAASGPSISSIAEVARKRGIYIVAGTILEKKGPGLPLNTCFLVGPDGRIAARYSKMHLFDIHVPGRIRFEESRCMRPGAHASIATTPFGTIGFAVCNDLRYPELFRRMALAGARIVFVPSAFTKFTGRDHWLALTRVRAIENQCFIAAANQSGKNSSGVRFFGSSVIVDPWGRLLAEGPPRGDAVVSSPIDLAAACEIRAQLPALRKIRARYPLKSF